MSTEAGAALPFPREEHLSRQARLRSELLRRGLDAMLVFAQESHFWLTGYDTGGYVFFQCAVVTASDCPIVLLTRRPDLLQARQTSTIKDIRIWWDADDANPAMDLKSILEELGLKGGRIGIELNTHGLTGWNLWRVQNALDGWCTLVDDDHLIRGLRLIKSPAEIAYTRKAAEILDRSLEAVIAASRPGVLDSEIKAAYLTSILRDGADMPPNPPLFNSGPRAVYGRGVSEPRRIEAQDQILVEYPVCLSPLQREKRSGQSCSARCRRHTRKMYDVARETLHRMTEIAAPRNGHSAKYSTCMPRGSTKAATRGTVMERRVTRWAAPFPPPAWMCRR